MAFRALSGGSIADALLPRPADAALYVDALRSLAARRAAARDPAPRPAPAHRRPRRLRRAAHAPLAGGLRPPWPRRARHLLLPAEPRPARRHRPRAVAGHTALRITSSRTASNREGQGAAQPPATDPRPALPARRLYPPPAGGPAR